MTRIATWADANQFTSTQGYPSNKCPTKSEITARGALVENIPMVASNQLVRVDKISKADVGTWLITGVSITFPVNPWAVTETIKVTAPSGKSWTITATGDAILPTPSSGVGSRDVSVRVMPHAGLRRGTYQLREGSSSGTVRASSRYNTRGHTGGIIPDL